MDVLGRLGFDTGEGMAFRLGLDNADRLAIGVEKVVGKSGREREFPDRDAQPGRDVHLSGILDDPAALGELLIDLQSGLFFRGRHDARFLFAIVLGSPPIR